MVRVLKTIGYDVDFVSAEGPYLTDAAGARYLDLLSGFGVFAIGRNHPAVIDALKQVLDARLAEPRADGRVAAGGHPGRAPAGLHAGHGPRLLLLDRLGSGGERGQVRARRHRPRQDRLLQQRLPRPHHGRPLAQRQRGVQEGLRAAAAGLRAGAVQRPAGAGGGAARQRCRRLLRRADPGQGRVYARRRLSAAGAGAVPEVRHALHRRRDPDRHGTHRQVPGLRALGRRSRHGAAVEVALRRLRSGRRAPHQAVDLLQAVRPHGPRHGARLDLQQERPGHGSGARHPGA